MQFLDLTGLKQIWQKITDTFIPLDHGTKRYGVINMPENITWTIDPSNNPVEYHRNQSVAEVSIGANMPLVCGGYRKDVERDQSGWGVWFPNSRNGDPEMRMTNVANTKVSLMHANGLAFNDSQNYLTKIEENVISLGSREGMPASINISGQDSDIYLNGEPYAEPLSSEDLSSILV